MIGFAGEARIGGQPTDKWLQKFIDDNLEFGCFRDLCESLRAKVKCARRADEGSDAARPLMFHVAGFEDWDGIIVPVIWLVKNAYDIGMDGYKCGKFFKKSEEFWKYFPQTKPQHIRTIISDRATAYSPFGFQQGIDLGTFGMITSGLQAAFRVLCEQHPRHSFPKTLVDWESQVRMFVLTYGAYFQAYKSPVEQPVGGGADIVPCPGQMVAARTLTASRRRGCCA